MTVDTDCATAPEVSIFDLEDPITRASNAGKLVEVMLDRILESRQLQAFSGAGQLALLIGQDEADAALHSVSELRDALRTLTGSWMAALKQQP